MQSKAEISSIVLAGSQGIVDAIVDKLLEVAQLTPLLIVNGDPHPLSGVSVDPHDVNLLFSKSIREANPLNDGFGLFYLMDESGTNVFVSLCLQDATERAVISVETLPTGKRKVTRIITEFETEDRPPIGVPAISTDGDKYLTMSDTEEINLFLMVMFSVLVIPELPE